VRLKTGALCAALALCASLPAGAQAATTATLTPSLSPDKLGATTALTLAVRYSNTEIGLPAPVSGMVLHLPAGLEVNLGGAICTKAHVLAHNGRKCPPSSRVGTGSALAAGRIGDKTVDESATLTAYRDADQGLALVGLGLTPLEERVVLTGVVELDEPPYGLELKMKVPPIATLPTEPNASTLHISLTLGSARRGRGGRGGLIQMPRSCPAGGFPFAADFTYAGGGTSETVAKVPCP
jgi:hypothetical protein